MHFLWYNLSRGVTMTKIERLDHQGRGIAYIDDKITFVENALPGEEVLIKITNSKKKYNEGIVEKYIQKSEKRVDNVCPFYESCGGCNILHMSYNDQLEYKENKIKDIMKKYANVDKVSKIVKCDKQFNYRNKVTLKVENNIIGYYGKKSYNLVNIDKCLIIDNEFNKIINDLKKFNLDNIYELMIRNVDSKNTALTLYLQKDTNCIQIEEYCKKNNIILNKIIKNKDFKCNEKSKIIGKLGDFKFIISPLSFFQVNTNQTIKLYDKILELLDPNKDDNLLDLYCGTGTIGIYVASKVNKVLGVEIVKDAIHDANINKEINNINNINFICGNTEKIIKDVKDKYNAIIVDPPRAGLTESVIRDIFRINPDKIIYVSCDPITLARDLKLLQERYEVLDVVPVDMFPNTYHVETVVSMSRVSK